MKFEEILPELKRGKRVVRLSKNKELFLTENTFGRALTTKDSTGKISVYTLKTSDILADDWKINN